jgi:acyl-[acyl carrier protein]--UDP-N-acetylglucosamine O-acyltransferase
MLKHVIAVLQYILIHGEVKRGKVMNITGLKRRSVTDLISELLKHRYVQAQSSKGPLQLRLNSKLALALFPELI